MDGSYHVPVLRETIIESLAVKPGGVYLDCTLGGGGHFEAILRAMGGEGVLVGIDKDPQSLSHMRQRVTSTKVNVILEQQKFSLFDSVLDAHGIAAVDGMLLDLGVSSHQIDTPERGFSYMHDAPLDMRMDTGNGVGAGEFLDQSDENEIARVLWEYGEITNASRMARAIKNYSHTDRIKTSGDLKRCIEREYGSAKIKVLSKLFQALRIAVNGELDELRACLDKAPDRLRPEGRIAVISYHSLEDRIVKNFYRDQERTCSCPKESPVCTCSNSAKLKRVNKKPIVPAESEIAQNRRARSACLRVARKI